jgi:hypothetical protein
MTECGKDSGFTFESRDTLNVSRKGFGQDFNSSASFKLRIGGLIPFHSARSQVRRDFVVCQPRTDPGLLEQPPDSIKQDVSHSLV